MNRLQAEDKKRLNPLLFKARFFTSLFGKLRRFITFSVTFVGLCGLWFVLTAITPIDQPPLPNFVMPLKTFHHASQLEEGKIKVANHLITVELAKREKHHAYGLMNRESLPHDRGMLFVFFTDEVRHFWMKNTLIPLDIIYINSDGVVETIVKASPCLKDPCPSFSSKKPIRYVLELNQGESEQLGIKEGYQFLPVK